MYENIGKKIKILAKILFGVLCAIGVIGGIVIASIDDYYTLIGVIVMVLLPLTAWISSWFLYGFGEIIDKLTDIEDNTRKSLINSARNSQLDIKTGEKIKKTEEKLKKLEGLLNQGLITKEEYEENVAKIEEV